MLARLTAARAPVCGLALDRPRIMGVLNVTPDSFSDGGRHLALADAVARARAMAEAGADILDVGGESTRPGADPVPPAAEIERVVPVIAALQGRGLRAADLDRHAERRGGARRLRRRRRPLQRRLGADPRPGEPRARRGLRPAGLPDARPGRSEDDAGGAGLRRRAARRRRLARGARRGGRGGGDRRATRILVDPGIGFGKTVAHNLALVRGLAILHGLGCAILFGASRKRFIGTIGDAPDAGDRLPGSIAVALEALRQGAQVIRVHDVKETRQAVALWAALNGDDE